MQMKKTNTGFTLIEVMIALIVAAIALSANISSLTAYTDLYTHLHKRYWGQIIGSNQVLRYTQPTLFQGNVETNGYSEMLGTKWYWKIAETSTDIQSIYRIDLTISQKSDYSDIAQKITTLLYK